MKRLSQVLLLSCFIPTLVAASEPVFSAKLKIIRGPISVGGEPLALVKIKNKNKERIFVDVKRFKNSFQIQYGNEPLATPAIYADTGMMVDHGSLPNRDITNSSIIAIEPGQEIERVVQIERLTKSGQAVISVLTFFPWSHLRTIDKINWSDSMVTARLPVTVLPSAD